MKHIRRLRFALGTVAIAASALFLTPAITSGELDLPGIEARLDNHEARITNNEKDIKTLQVSTNTEAASDHVSVPVVAQSTPAPGVGPEASPGPTATPKPTPEVTPSPAPVSITGQQTGNVKLTN